MSKPQIPKNDQEPMTMDRDSVRESPPIGDWFLVILWDLGFEHWSFLSEVPDDFFAGDGAQRPPRGGEVDRLVDEANGAVAEQHVDAAGVAAAGGGGVVGA